MKTYGEKCNMYTEHAIAEASIMILIENMQSSEKYRIRCNIYTHHKIAEATIMARNENIQCSEEYIKVNI